MSPRLPIAALAALCLSLALAACATVERFDAAGDIHAFLVAIRDNDRQTFDAHVDRPALKAQLKTRFTAEMIRRGGAMGGTLAQVLGGLADPLVDAAVQPSVFLAVAEANGYKPSQPLPGRTAIAGALRDIPDGRVCVVTKRDGPCVLIFRNEGGVWRLVAFEGSTGMLRLPPELAR